MKGYESIQEIIKRLRASSHWATQYAHVGRITGFERFDHCWVIPEDAVKPQRMKPGAISCVEYGQAETSGELVFYQIVRHN